MLTEHPTAPHESRLGTPLYDADATPADQVTAMLDVVRAWPANVRPSEDKAAALLAYAAGLRVIADELDP